MSCNPATTLRLTWYWCIVHTASWFGEDDYNVGAATGLGCCTVNERVLWWLMPALTLVNLRQGGTKFSYLTVIFSLSSRRNLSHFHTHLTGVPRNQSPAQVPQWFASVSKFRQEIWWNWKAVPLEWGSASYNERFVTVATGLSPRQRLGVPLPSLLYWRRNANHRLPETIKYSLLRNTFGFYHLWERWMC